jgi:putative addiction module killer protein
MTGGRDQRAIVAYRIHRSAPGYRIYYGTDDATIILLNGGDKSTQDSDIKIAKEFWNDYKTRKKPSK